MPPKTVYVPRFGSQLSSSQRGDPELDQAQASSPVLGDRHRNKRVRGSEKNALKVKFPKFGNRTEQTKKAREEDEENGTQGAVADSAFVNVDVFLFSQSNSMAVSEKDKAKLSVLRNISRMLEENKLIRQRLVSLSQANCSSTQ